MSGLNEFYVDHYQSQEDNNHIIIIVILHDTNAIGSIWIKSVTSFVTVIKSHGIDTNLLAAGNSFNALIGIYNIIILRDRGLEIKS